MRDCSALMSLEYIKNLLNMEDDSDIFDWIYTNQMEVEICNMIKESEEYNVINSYFPYQADLMLVNKAYYSNTKNLQTHLFIHSIGTLSKSGRSRNARHVSDINSLNFVQNAKIVAYAFATRFEFSKPFQEKDGPKDPDGEKEDQLDSEPESIDAHEWFTYYSYFCLIITLLYIINMTKPRKTTFCVPRDNLEVKPKFPGQYLECQYPSEWFTNNPGSKPSIMEHVRDLDEIGRTFQAYLKDGKVPVNLAVLFLHAYAKKLVTFAIDKDWKSYSVNIATKGETISPLNLLKVDEASDNGTDKKEHSYKEEHSH